MSASNQSLDFTVAVQPSVQSAEGLLAFQALGPQELKQLPQFRKLEILRELRLRPLRLPLLVSVCATDLVLGNKGGSLGDERWIIAEQGIVASLECGNVDNANALYKMLKTQFSEKSVRVRKLFGLILECRGDFNGAVKVYQGILRDSVGDAFVVKRQAAMLKSRGMYDDAIALLETKPIYNTADGTDFTYLDIHRGHEDNVYRELLYLHYVTGNIDRALRCAEEVVLMDPMSFVHHVRHAELCYAAGQLERAATIYSHSLRLNDSSNNVRALYGLWIVATDLVKQRSATSCDADAKALQSHAASRLKQLYTESPQYASLAMMLQRFS